MQLMYILPFPVFSLEINNYRHLFVTFSCCERSKLPIVMNVCMQDTFARARTRPSARATIGYLVYKMNVLHRINIALLIFRLYLSGLQV